MANDQAKVEFYRREELPLPLEFLQNYNLVIELGNALKQAEDTSRQLWGALSTLAMQFLFNKDQPESRQERQERDRLLNSWGAERRYWAALEIPFYRLVTELPEDKQAAFDHWVRAVRSAAWEAFNAVAENLGEDPLTLKVIVLARGQLGGGLAKVLIPGTHRMQGG